MILPSVPLLALLIFTGAPGFQDVPVDLVNASWDVADVASLQLS